MTVDIDDFWVSPGAPDVHLLVSPRADGQVDHTAVDLGPVPDQERRLSRPLPAEVDRDWIPNPSRDASRWSQSPSCSQRFAMSGSGSMTPLLITPGVGHHAEGA